MLYISVRSLLMYNNVGAVKITAAGIYALTLKYLHTCCVQVKKGCLVSYNEINEGCHLDPPLEVITTKVFSKVKQSCAWRLQI